MLRLFKGCQEMVELVRNFQQTNQTNQQSTYKDLDAYLCNTTISVLD